MKVLINERLSEHKYKTPEGYLICQDAILARTGKQTYRRNEVFNDSSDEEVEVDRKPEQVFSPQTLASFENKPVTVEHPDEDVNPSNYKEYSVGFVRDVHRGVADGQDVILGTLVITDAKTIEEIENGEHTELSCGYDCDIEDNDAPEQKNIRGNHVALCEQGRAGIARIVDSDVKDLTNREFGNEIYSKLNSNGIKANVISSPPKYSYGYNFVSVYVKNPDDFEKAKNILSDYNLRIKGNVIHIMKDSVKDETPTYQYYRKEILKAKNKVEMDDLEFNIEEEYDKKAITDDEYLRLHRTINTLRPTLDSVKDSADVFNDLRRRIYGTKDNYYGFNLLLKSIERARQYGSLEDREAEILTELWQETKKKYYAKDSVEDGKISPRRFDALLNLLYDKGYKFTVNTYSETFFFNDTNDYENVKSFLDKNNYKYSAGDMSVGRKYIEIRDSVEDAEENYNDLRKIILNTKNNKDEFEGILNRIDRAKAAGTISDIEVNLLKRFWNDKKEQYYPKNPINKPEGMVIEYIDGTDHQKKYIRIKTGTYSKAQGIYRLLQSKNPKKYSSQYGLIPMGGSQAQEWKPFSQTHPNAKFEEVYDMKDKKSGYDYYIGMIEKSKSKSEIDDWIDEIEEDYHKDHLNDKEYKLLISKADRAKSKLKDSIEDAKNYSKMNDLGYQYFENRLRENNVKIKHTHVQSENPYTLIYDVELEGSAHKLRFILQTMTNTLKRYGIEMSYDLNENYPPKAKITTKVSSTKDSMTKDISDLDLEDLMDTFWDAGIRGYDIRKEGYEHFFYFKNEADLEKAKSVAGRYDRLCKLKKDSVKDGRWLIKGDMENVKKLLMSNANPKQFISSLIGRNQYALKVTFANAEDMEKAKKFLWSRNGYDVIEGKDAGGYYLRIGSNIYDSMTKDDFSTKSAQGYSVERLERANSGRYYAILKRANDYVVAAGYDIKDGTWGQGYYDYKTYEDALKAIKKAKARAGDSVKDAMPVYEIRWIDLYKKSKGYPDFKYVAEIKANTLREALEKLKAKVAMGGVGTHNAMIMNIHGNGKTYMYNGRLDEVLAMNIKDSSGIKTRELD